MGKLAAFSNKNFSAASQDLDPKKEQFVVSEALILPQNMYWLVLWEFSSFFRKGETEFSVI